LRPRAMSNTSRCGTALTDMPAKRRRQPARGVTPHSPAPRDHRFRFPGTNDFNLTLV
jgi:hypothetical protein